MTIKKEIDGVEILDWTWLSEDFEGIHARLETNRDRGLIARRTVQKGACQGPRGKLQVEQTVRIGSRIPKLRTGFGSGRISTEDCYCCKCLSIGNVFNINQRTNPHPKTDSCDCHFKQDLVQSTRGIHCILAFAPCRICREKRQILLNLTSHKG